MFGLFRHLTRIIEHRARLARATALRQRTQRAYRIFRRANRRPQIHQALRKIPCPLGYQRFRQPRDHRPRFRHRLLDLINTRQHPLDIAIHRHDPSIKRNRSDCPRRVSANARKLQQCINTVGKPSAVTLDHLNRTSMQVARPRIIAEPRPKPEHLIPLGACHILNGWKASRERVEIGNDGFHPRLLEHDLGKPNAIGIGLLSRKRAPRQHATVAVVPIEQHFIEKRINLPFIYHKRHIPYKHIGFLLPLGRRCLRSRRMRV